LQSLCSSYINNALLSFISLHQIFLVLFHINPSHSFIVSSTEKVPWYYIYSKFTCVTYHQPLMLIIYPHRRLVHFHITTLKSDLVLFILTLPIHPLYHRPKSSLVLPKLSGVHSCNTPINPFIVSLTKKVPWYSIYSKITRVTHHQPLMPLIYLHCRLVRFHTTTHKSDLVLFILTLPIHPSYHQPKSSLVLPKLSGVHWCNTPINPFIVSSTEKVPGMLYIQSSLVQTVIILSSGTSLPSTCSSFSYA